MATNHPETVVHHTNREIRDGTLPAINTGENFGIPTVIGEEATNPQQTEGLYHEVPMPGDHPVDEVLTSLSYKKRKRGKDGPDSCLTPSAPCALSTAIASAKDRQGEPVFFPREGTTFNSYEEAKEFYNMYSWEIGFGIRESRPKKNRNGYTTRKDIVCSCEGFSVNPNAASSRSGCKAGVHLLRTSDHSWIINKVETNHNHPLSISYGEKKQWPSHSFIDPMTKEFIKNLRRNNVPLGRVCSIVGVLATENNIPIRRQAVKTLCAQIAQEDIKDDMQKTMQLLENMQKQDKGFEVRFRTDKEDVIESMLWCTGKNRSNYQLYGDVMTFDTTYRTNLYNLPFGIFVGVNSHYQTIIFGGVLLRHERTIDFEWAFNSFTEIMGGKQPATVLTDQCQAMASAIKSVWKGTRHRWCRWHILRLAKQKIGPQYSKQSTFKKKFNRLITFEVSPAEFERQWNDLLAEYKLADNKFLERAYRFRGMWAKPYFMDIFCAGMTSTQRSESANHMLKRFIQRGAPMHLFVEKFRDFQFGIDQEEERENFKTKMQSRRKRLGLALEGDAESIYTREMYERFFKELYESAAYTIIKKSANNRTFIVVHNNDLDKDSSREYTVTIVSSEAAKCSCGLYEHAGLPCRHSLKVLVHLDIKKIPSGNIHVRWTRAYAETNVHVEEQRDEHYTSSHGKELKRRMLIMKAIELSQHNNEMEDQDYNEAVEAIQKLMQKVQARNKVQDTTTARQATKTDNICCPPRVKRACRPRDTSLKSWKRNSKLEKEDKRADDEQQAILNEASDVYNAGRTRKLSDLLHVT